MNKKELEELLLLIAEQTNIGIDILEKDYYVCLVLRDLASKQENLKAYFKGGTALYKILDTMYRFSEDIDLTVRVIDTDSRTSNINRLKKSALGYKIDGLELLKDKCEDKKGSVIAYYEYNTLFPTSDLFKAGEIQVESTSFTVSEPTCTYLISPLVYKYATDEQKVILKERYDICDFEIETIKLERIFVDKIFAAEFYYIRKKYKDVAKHLYDITVLLKTDAIKKLLGNKDEFDKLVLFKRMEERIRVGGIDENLEISDFSYLKLEFEEELIKTFIDMQNIYILDDKYKITIEEVIDALKELINCISLVH